MPILFLAGGAYPTGGIRSLAHAPGFGADLKLLLEGRLGVSVLDVVGHEGVTRADRREAVLVAPLGEGRALGDVHDQNCNGF